MLKPDQQTKSAHTTVPEGTHVATCYSLLHLGHVPNTYPGAENPTINKIRLTWELPELLNVFKEGEEARPYSISQEYTLSMGDKANLRKAVESWLGKKFSDAEAVNFDVEELVGKSCMLGVVHIETKAGNPFAVVNSVMRLPASVKTEQINKSKIITWDTMTVDIFNKLPTFIQDKMKTSTEYKDWAKSQGSGTYDYPESGPESIPF